MNFEFRTSSVLRAIAVAALLGVSATATQAATLVVDTAFQLKTADPARQFEPTANLFMHAVYQNLVTFDGDDLTTIVPSLAGVPVISEDAKTFTFTLNPEAKFSDGTPITVDDVIFSLERVKNVKGSPSFLMDGVSVAKGAADGEVVLTTESADPGLPFKLTNPALAILNSKLIAANGGFSDVEASTTDKADVFMATTSVGSGPYILTKFDMASEVVLSRNDAYWGEPAAYDQIVLRNVESSAQQMNVMRGASQIAIDLRPDQLETLGDTVNVVSTAGSDVGFLFVNANPAISEVAANADFREAVRYGIDYDGLLEIVGEGALRPGSVVPSMFGGALDATKAAVRDVERAKAALARSGLADPTIDFSYAGDLTKNGVSFADVAAKIQSDLAEVGITVELKPEPVSANIDGYRAGTLAMSVQWWGPDFPDPSNYLLFNPGQMVGLRAGWAEGAAPEVVTIGAEAAASIDPVARPELYAQWQTALNEAGPFISLFQPALTLVSSKEITELEYNPMWTVDLGSVAPVTE